jgi:hypothetical protein
MSDEILKIITSEASDMLQPLIDKIGVGAIAATVTLTTAQESDLIPQTILPVSTWGMTDYALAISMITGVLFGIEKIINIVFKIKDRNKNSDKE